MLFMNTWEIDQAAARLRDHEVLGPAARFLQNFRDLINANSDGWAYWRQPVRAAAKLQQLLGDAVKPFVVRGGGPVTRPEVTAADVRKALTPIKAFCTRKKLKLPEGCPT